jgi:hypothetical protein
LPESNKSKKTLAIRADSRGRPSAASHTSCGHFSIIDLAKISTSPICSLSAVLLARPILTPVLPPEDQCFARQIACTNGEATTSVGVSFIESTAMNDQTRLILVGIVTAAICGVLVYAAFSHLMI